MTITHDQDKKCYTPCSLNTKMHGKCSCENKVKASKYYRDEDNRN